eukprot:gnl/MRDRNA2_/MRDRNA2_32420_c0_seq1.p1 gnl/MRDRNA2_/MRDRNA2_32420_c0~~gnl/MRDRNA2_/MRDRNA2_32420_c0_seq1.p1  ORF type:complete len:400 (+),score=86.16 gnl/MRDRNA2_/MRDRNA2_32420_c0_seq1:69-1268(+)
MSNFGRSPTFLVGAGKQRGILEEFHRRDEHYSTEYTKNKPLCFSAESYQKTHPRKAMLGYKDADATLTLPMLLGVCDGVSQMEDYGIDASELPNELLNACQELAMQQLMPDGPQSPADQYRGPISLLTEAFEATESLGSTTVLLAALDNSTKIHGKLHPMIAVLSIGDCELMVLRRTQGPQSQLELVFNTEMQRIDQNCQTPLQLARVDERIDEEYDEQIAMAVIHKGSAVHCVSAYEGDILIMGSDGVFDNLFQDEIVQIVNNFVKPFGGSFVPNSQSLLKKVSQAIIRAAHDKCPDDDSGGLPDTPIGRGGKSDDTSVVVAEIVEWTEAHREFWSQGRSRQSWQAVFDCGGAHCGRDDDDEEDDGPSRRRRGKEMHDEEHEEWSEEEEDEGPKCTIQ